MLRVCVKSAAFWDVPLVRTFFSDRSSSRKRVFFARYRGREERNLRLRRVPGLHYYGDSPLNPLVRHAGNRVRARWARARPFKRERLLKLSDNRDRLRSIRPPRPLRRLAFLGRFRQTQSEPPWKPDLPQEILIVVTMEYELWHLVSILRFHSVSEDEDAASRALHQEHVGVPIDTGHVIDIAR